MTLRDWLRKGWLTEHRTSRQEIGDLLAAADRDLSDCRAVGLSADWRLSIAHNAALLCARRPWRPVASAPRATGITTG